MKDSPSSFLFCQDNFKQLTLICSCGQKKAWILFKTSGLIYRALENSQHNSLQLKFYKMPFTLNKINNIILFTSNLLDAHNNTLAATRPCRGVQTSFTIGCQFCPSLTLLSLHPMIFFILTLVSPFRSIFVECCMSNNAKTFLWVNLSWYDAARQSQTTERLQNPQQK